MQCILKMTGIYNMQFNKKVKRLITVIKKKKKLNTNITTTNNNLQHY